MKRIQAILFILLCGTLILRGTIIKAETSARPFTETMTSMGHCISGEELFVNSLTVSPDSRHLAYVSRIGPHFRVWLDGVAETTYEGVTRQSPFFSPQKNRLAYIVQEDGQMFAVVDSKSYTKYDIIGSFTFSPDGSHFAYRVQNKNGEQFVVTDEQKGPVFPVGVPPKIGIIFSPDSKNIAYAGINQNNSHILVKNNKKVASYSKIIDIQFSPDSQHLAAICQDENMWMVVKDGEKGKPYQRVNNLIFSPDAEHLAYTAQKNGEIIVVKDQKEFDDGKGAINPIFSPDGSRFAYLAIDGDEKCRYIIDGKKGMVIGRPGRLIFSGDSTRVAYGAWIGGKWHLISDGHKGPAFEKILFFSFSPFTSDLVYGGLKEDGQACVVINGEQQKPYPSVMVPEFSPHKNTIAYVAATEQKKMVMVVNGEEQKPYPVIGIPSKEKAGKLVFTAKQPFFSPDGKRLAYPVFTEEKEAFMVVDGQEHPRFETVGRPCFSPDGNHIAYTAYQDGKSLVVIDGIASENRFDGIPRDATLTFADDNHCYLLVVQETDPGPSFFRLDIEIQ